MNPLQDFLELPKDVQGLCYLLSSGKIKDYEDVYMVDVKKGSSFDDIKEDLDNLILYNHPNQFKNSNPNLFNSNWITVHRSDFKAIQPYYLATIETQLKEKINKE